jgi:hypothetical protein
MLRYSRRESKKKNKIQYTVLYSTKFSVAEPEPYRDAAPAAPADVVQHG